MTLASKEEYAVLQDLFSNTNTNVRPVESARDVVKVSMSLTLNQILDMVSQGQTDMVSQGQTYMVSQGQTDMVSQGQNDMVS